MTEEQLRRAILDGFLEGNFGGFTISQIKDVSNSIITQAKKAGLIRVEVAHEDYCDKLADDNAACNC